MDNDYENYSQQGDGFSYDLSPLYTDQVFTSVDEMMNWAKTTARSLGYVLVKRRLDKNTVGHVTSISLKCDRGGMYTGKGSTSSRSTGTRKINCPFQLDGYMTYHGWRVDVKDHNHNHGPTKYFEDHSFARRLTQEEKVWVQTLAKQNLPPRDILANLKQQFPDNVSTIKDIYNARAEIKSKRAEQLENTPMQVMLSLLHDNNYSYDFTTEVGSNRLENLFFVHPESYQVLCAFPYVVLIDATYKTNIYNMPFVEIVGVTSTSKTFRIACAFVKNEKTDTYKWVLECLKSTFGADLEVRVIITDMEIALMNACRDVWSNAAGLLCRFHIMQNIKKHVQPKFQSERQWVSFVGRWKRLLASCTYREYGYNELELRTYLNDFPGAFLYLEQNWLAPYKEMFMSCWADEHLNFRNYTTNRVESEHALLKAHLCGKSTFHSLLGA